MGDSYGIILNDAHEFAVWPSDRKVPPGWHFAGPTGTRAELGEVLRRQFVETAPAPFIASDRRPRLSQGAD
jgi:MbtH protein